MKNRILIGTVAVAMLVGVVSVSACQRHRTPTERADRLSGKIAKELDLNDQQKAKLEAVKQEFLAARAEMRKEHEAMFNEVLAQVQADQLDQAKLLQLFERHQALGTRLAPRVVAKVAEFHAGLTPQQKSEASEHLKHLRERMHQHEGSARM